jgi:CRISPR/Cas system-associated protein Csm6
MVIPLPSIPPETIALVVTAFLAGAACPVYYAQERLRGFGRAMMAKLPYQPPPGKQTEEAMVEATSEESTDTEPQTDRQEAQ